jgi:hypothetical protein
MNLMSRTLFATLVLIVVFFLAGYLNNFYARKRAEQLLRDLQTLNVGTSTAEDTRHIITRYGGWEMNRNPDPRDVAPWGIGPCSGPHPRYGLSVAPELLNRFVVTFPQVQHLGFHIWGVEADIDVKDGKVLCFSQNVRVHRSDGHDVEARAEMVEESLRPEEAENYLLIRNYIHEIRTSVLPNSSTTEKGRAFGVDLACVTSFGGCFYPCQLAPQVWDDLSQRYKKEGWAIEGENDPRCRQTLPKP